MKWLDIQHVISSKDIFSSSKSVRSKLITVIFVIWIVNWNYVVSRFPVKQRSVLWQFYSINDNQNMLIMRFYMKSIQVDKDGALGRKEWKEDRERKIWWERERNETVRENGMVRRCGLILTIGLNQQQLRMFAKGVNQIEQ